MRTFVLNRREDSTGVSGTGMVAEGTLYASGKVTLAWTTAVSSVAVYDSIEDVIQIHGHNGSTEILWMDTVKFHEQTPTTEDITRLDVDNAMRELRIFNPKPGIPLETTVSGHEIVAMARRFSELEARIIALEDLH